MGNYDKALVLYIQAKDIREKALGKDHPEFAQALNVLARLHKDMGNFDNFNPFSSFSSPTHSLPPPP